MQLCAMPFIEGDGGRFVVSEGFNCFRAANLEFC